MIHKQTGGSVHRSLSAPARQVTVGSEAAETVYFHLPGQPRFCFGAVPNLLPLVGEPAKGFLCQFTGIIAIAGQAQRKGEQALIMGLNRRLHRARGD